MQAVRKGTDNNNLVSRLMIWLISIQHWSSSSQQQCCHGNYYCKLIFIHGDFISLLTGLQQEILMTKLCESCEKFLRIIICVWIKPGLHAVIFFKQVCSHWFLKFTSLLNFLIRPVTGCHYCKFLIKREYLIQQSCCFVSHRENIKLRTRNINPYFL